jgi:hypothetical protein
MPFRLVRGDIPGVENLILASAVVREFQGPRDSPVHSAVPL